MSSIAFHFRGGKTLRIGGMERAAFGCLVNQLALIGYDCSNNAEILVPHASTRRDDGDYLSHGQGPASDRLELWIKVNMWGESWRFGKNVYDLDPVALNTALALGSRAVGLAARLHGQCELHAWIAPDDMSFIAEVIDEGLVCGVFRENTGYDGWRALASALRTGEGPVVTSYSVCASWPDRDLTSYGEAAWERRDYEARRKSAFRALTKLHGLQIKPDGLSYTTFWYGQRKTAFDIVRMARPKGEEAPDADV